MHKGAVKGIDVIFVVSGAVPVIVSDKVVVERVVDFTGKLCTADNSVFLYVELKDLCLRKRFRKGLGSGRDGSSKKGKQQK